MRKGRRILKYFTIAAIVILLLLFVFYLFLKYQDRQSYKNVVHKEADLIIKINRNQLIKKIGLNALANPEYYFASDKKDSLEREEDEALNKGFDLKANIFIYNLKSAPLTFYTTFEVNDSSALRVFLQEKFEINKFDHKEKYNYGYSTDGKLQAIYNQSSLVFSYAFDKKHDQDIIEEIIIKKKFLRSDHTLIGSLKEHDKDIVLVEGTNVGNLSFENGAILLSASVQMEEYFEVPDQLSFVGVDTSNSFHLSLAGNIPPPLSRDYVFNSIKIPLDSILYNYTGHLDVRISGKAIQGDSIVTYEYNDDFEKIETKSLQEKEVPGVSLWIEGNAAEINRLLIKENIVRNNQINRELFPLLNLNVKTEDSGTIRISNLEMQRKKDVSNPGEFFLLYADFARLRTDCALPIPQRYFEDLKKLEISASKTDDKIVLKGQLLLHDDQINALIQLINFMNSL